MNWLADNAEDQQIGVVVMAFSIDSDAGVAAGHQRPLGAGRRDRRRERQPADRGRPGGAGQVRRAGTGRGRRPARSIPPATPTTSSPSPPPRPGCPSRRTRCRTRPASRCAAAAIDAAVPTYGAVTLAPNGATCLVDQIATSWAAGVAGRRGRAGAVGVPPTRTPPRSRHGCIATASGSSVRPNTATGHGVLQPVEAVTRDLAPTKDGDVDDMPRADMAQPRVTAPVAGARPPGRHPRRRPLVGPVRRRRTRRRAAAPTAAPSPVELDSCNVIRSGRSDDRTV